MHEYGTTREQMAPFMVNNRKNALMWKHGYWYQHRPEPLTEADYLSGRMISCRSACTIAISQSKAVAHS
jgi:hypothetical protein